MRNAHQFLGGVQQEARGRVHEWGVASRDDGAIRKFDCRTAEDAIVPFALRLGSLGCLPSRLHDAATGGA